jgi:hypothetical protein
LLTSLVNVIILSPLFVTLAGHAAIKNLAMTSSGSQDGASKPGATLNPRVASPGNFTQWRFSIGSDQGRLLINDGRHRLDVSSQPALSTPSSPATARRGLATSRR